jgi:hypothetical protein
VRRSRVLYPKYWVAKMLPGGCRQTEEDAKGKSGKRGVLGDDSFLLVVTPGQTGASPAPARYAGWERPGPGSLYRIT